MVCFWSGQLSSQPQLSSPNAIHCSLPFSYDNLCLPIQAIDREVSEICSDIIGEIIEAALETLEDVCDSLQNLLNIHSPGMYSDLLFWNPPPMELELEEHDESLQTPPSLFLDSPAAPPPSPLCRNILEEMFDKNNMPTSEFLRRDRSFAGDIIYRHF